MNWSILRKIRFELPPVVRVFVLRNIVCARRGHISTGLMLWWMCDRCLSDFSATALPSEWTPEGKVTRSR